MLIQKWQNDIQRLRDGVQCAYLETIDGRPTIIWCDWILTNVNIIGYDRNSVFVTVCYNNSDVIINKQQFIKPVITYLESLIAMFS
jgi:hypothetical protein